MQRWTLGFTGFLLVAVAGCKPGAGDSPRPPAPAAPAAPASSVLHPCELLSNAAISGVVADAKPGRRDTGDEPHGISTCRWEAGDAAVVLQVFDAGPGALARELQGAALENVDLQREDAATLVRLEPFAGIPDYAGAFVERADTIRGITRSNAVLMVHRGNRLAVLRIPQLAEGDRDRALATLKELGTSIAKGL